MQQPQFSTLQYYCEQSSPSTQQYNPFQLELEPLQPSYSFDEQHTQDLYPQSQSVTLRQRHFLIKVDGRAIYVQTKDELKERLLSIIECHHLEQIMDKFSQQLWNWSPWSLCVLIAEQLWNYLQESNEDLWLSTWMIQSALLRIKPQKISTTQSKIHKLSKMIKDSIY